MKSGAEPTEEHRGSQRTDELHRDEAGRVDRPNGGEHIVKQRARVTAGLANDVEAANQYRRGDIRARS